MEKKFCEIRILGVCTAVDNFAHPSQRRHGNQNMKSSLYQPTPFLWEKCNPSKSTKFRRIEKNHICRVQDSLKLFDFLKPN